MLQVLGIPVRIEGDVGEFIRMTPKVVGKDAERNLRNGRRECFCWKFDMEYCIINGESKRRLERRPFAWKLFPP